MHGVAPDALTVALLRKKSGKPVEDRVIVGTYDKAGIHHGRPVYRKRGGAIYQQGEFEVVLHYSTNKGSDGSEDAGWWFSPAVNSKEAWAFNDGCMAAPPRKGWIIASMLGRSSEDMKLRVKPLAAVRSPPALRAERVPSRSRSRRDSRGSVRRPGADDDVQ